MKKEVEFNIVREEWTVVKLDSGTVIKHRMNVEEIEFDEEEKLAFPKFGSSYHVLRSKEDLGPPNDKYEPGSTTDADVIRESKLEFLREPINIYELPDEKAIVLSK